jgi:hypothetical protein
MQPPGEKAREAPFHKVGQLFFKLREASPTHKALNIPYIIMLTLNTTCAAGVCARHMTGRPSCVFSFTERG